MNKLTTVSFALLAACIDQPDFTSEVDQEVFVASSLFEKAKQLETQFPKIPAHSTIDVGTIDSINGTFDGLRTWSEVFIDEDTGKPRQITRSPSVSIDGINATLSFTCTHRPKLTSGQFYAVINGVQYTAQSSSTLTIDVKLTKLVNWTVKCDGNTFTDKLTISRPRANGVGAFEIQAFPIGLLYEPPMNAGKTNWAAYTTSTQRSAAISIGSSTTNSTTSAPIFDSITDLSNKLDALKVDVPGMSSLLGELKSALGSSSTTITNSTTVSSDHTLEYKVTSTSSIKTAAKAGPGHGDIVKYLRRARFVWTMVRGDVAVTLIDSEQIYGRTIDELRAEYDALATQPSGTLGVDTGLDRQTIAGLMGLDVFVGTWDSNRLEYVTNNNLAGGEIWNDGVCRTYTETDKVMRSTNKTTVTRTEGGWLADVGLAHSDGSSSTSVTQSTARTASTSSTVCATFELSRTASEAAYGVDVYFDKQFGTFVFMKI